MSDEFEPCGRSHIRLVGTYHNIPVVETSDDIFAPGPPVDYIDVMNDDPLMFMPMRWTDRIALWVGNRLIALGCKMTGRDEWDIWR